MTSDEAFSQLNDPCNERAKDAQVWYLALMADHDRDARMGRSLDRPRVLQYSAPSRQGAIPMILTGIACAVVLCALFLAAEAGWG